MAVATTPANAVPAAKQAFTLRAAFGRFVDFGSPRIIMTFWVASVVLRLVVGQWAWRDLLAAAIVVAAQPFVEWVLHVCVLHFKPRKIFGWKCDPMLPRAHRAHHADPWDEKLRFIILPSVVSLVAAIWVIPWLVNSDKGLAASLTLTMMSLLMSYEWIHYLVHSKYVPKSRLYRYVWRAHRLHHFKNEHYWFGVTMHQADWLFGTFPSKDAVPTSITVRTLGVEADTAV